MPTVPAVTICSIALGRQSLLPMIRMTQSLCTAQLHLCTCERATQPEETCVHCWQLIRNGACLVPLCVKNSIADLRLPVPF